LYEIYLGVDLDKYEKKFLTEALRNILPTVPQEVKNKLNISESALKDINSYKTEKYGPRALMYASLG
jgi:hypothetical protein